MYYGPRAKELLLYIMGHFEAASVPAASAEEIAGMFIPESPESPHTIPATMSAILCMYDEAASPQILADLGGPSLTHYVRAFAAQSSVLKELDAEKPDLRCCGYMSGVGVLPQASYPDIIVTLADYIPRDEDGSFSTRIGFLETRLCQSQTMWHNLERYGYPPVLDPSSQGAPTAAWVLRRAFRATVEKFNDGSIRGNTRSSYALAENLASTMDAHAGIIRAVFDDFRRAPVLGNRRFNTLESRLI